MGTGVFRRRFDYPSRRERINPLFVTAPAQNVTAASVSMALSVPAATTKFTQTAASVAVALSVPTATTSFTQTAASVSVALSVATATTSFTQTAASVSVALSVPSASVSVGNLNITGEPVSVALSVVVGTVDTGDPQSVTGTPVSVALSITAGTVELIQTAASITITLTVTDNYAQVLAVFSTILNAVVTQIEALNLTGVADADVIRVKRPMNPLNGGSKADTGVQVFGINQIEAGGTNVRDDFYYRVGIVAFQKGNADQDLNEDRPPAWIQAIRREFQSKRLTGVSEAYFCTMEPATTVDPRVFPQYYDVSPMVVRVKTREVRTQ